MKKIISLSALLSMLVIISCRKPRVVVAPEPDTDTQTTVEAFGALFTITDAEQMGAFLAENQRDDHFYKADAGVVPNGTVATTQIGVDVKKLNMSFNQTHCADGKLREGTVFMDFSYTEDDYIKKYFTLYNIPNTTPRFYHEYGFLGRIDFAGYKVNGWTIKADSIANTNSFTSGVAYNYMGRSNYDPRKEPLKIRIVGSFVLYHPTDASKNMTIKCDLIKTVINSTSAQVFPSTVNDKLKPVNWALAQVSYSGKVEGTTANKAPYRMEISETSPLIRDFGCFPDRVSNVALGQPITAYIEEFHPFSSGVASFTTTLDGKDQYPRQVYFGNEGNLDLPAQCDNTGEVYIKGNSYKVNFWK